MKKIHDYVHYYRGYWSEGGKCRIRIYQEHKHAPVIVCSQLPDNPNTSITNMAEYLAAEIIRGHALLTPLVWIEHYPEHEGEIGEYSVVRFSDWEPVEVFLGGVWRYRIGTPSWAPLDAGGAGAMVIRTSSRSDVSNQLLGCTRAVDNMAVDLQEYRSMVREFRANNRLVTTEGQHPSKTDTYNTETSTQERLSNWHEANLETKSILQIQELPLHPGSGAHYVFDDVAREEVTKFNHGLHKYPAKFIPQLPRWAIKYAGIETGGVILDPFCGSGTTLVEAGMRGYSAVGYDISPLAVLVARAKTTMLNELRSEPRKLVERVIHQAVIAAPCILDALVDGSHDEDLHHTWTFWFRPLETARLLALRDAIVDEFADSEPQLATVLLACLSSVAKASSFLDENQIKVRKVGDKTIADPFTTFAKCAVPTLEVQLHLGQLFRNAGARFAIEAGSATKLGLEDASVDCVITSPPYINAVDYTMAHKYNLFLLGLVGPESFKAHCREYIGMSERAVRATDLAQMPSTGIRPVDRQVETIWAMDTPVSRNRDSPPMYLFDRCVGDLFATKIRFTRSMSPSASATRVRKFRASAGDSAQRIRERSAGSNTGDSTSSHSVSEVVLSSDFESAVSSSRKLSAELSAPLSACSASLYSLRCGSKLQTSGKEHSGGVGHL